QPRLQGGLDELIQVAVQHALGIAGFDAGAQVFYAGIVQHVGANLAAPADVGLAVLHGLLGLAALHHFQFAEFGPQHLHTVVAVLVLGALALALHHGIGGNVGDAHRRVGAVDVLAAGAAGPVGIGAQVRRVDVDLDGVVDFRGHEHRRKRRMAAVAGIERGFAHQAVHADLGAQPAEGVVPLDVDGGALDARHFAGGAFDQVGLEAFVVGPAQVHAQQHFRPILGLGAAGAGLDIQVGIVGVHLAGEHAAEFQLGKTGVEAAHFTANLLHRVGVVLVHRHLQQFPGIGDAAVEGFDGFHHRFEGGPLAAEVLGPLRVVPHVGVAELELYLGEALLLGGVVKDTP